MNQSKLELSTNVYTAKKSITELLRYVIIRPTVRCR